MITMHTTIRITASQVSSQITHETVILNIDNGKYYGLDPIGTFIWTQLRTPQTVNAIHRAMLEHYEVEADRCADDLVNLLNQLYSEGLITIVEDNSADK